MLCSVYSVEGCLFWPANAPACKAESRGSYQSGTRPHWSSLRLTLAFSHISNMPFNIDDDDEYVARLLSEDAKKTTKTYALVGLDAFNPKRCVRGL